MCVLAKNMAWFLKCQEAGVNVGYCSLRRKKLSTPILSGNNQITVIITRFQGRYYLELLKN
ncbi:MAG: hypothetical protein Q8N97_04360 [Methanobacteriaceae archaeon]|nr:hypothetical protein [Methanobacteriaceae archaeon]